MVIGTEVHSGGIEEISPGATASGTIVDSGGREIFSALGIAKGVTIKNGAELDLVGATISSGQTLKTGPAAATTVVSGVTVQSGGVISLLDTTILSGGNMILAAGSTASNVTISAGGALTGSGLLQGSSSLAGKVSFVTLSGGGADSSQPALDILTGGSVISASVTGGAIYVERGGKASGTQILSGAVEAVYAGGLTVGATIGSGGVQYVSVGGTTSAATVLSGGVEGIEKGAVVSALTVRPGAILDLAGVASASVSLNAAGQLVFSSAGVVVETVGLAGIPGGLAFNTQPDGANGTDVLISVARTDSVNLAPAAIGEAIPPSTVVASFADTAVGDTVGGLTATIAWGDGTTSVGAIAFRENGLFSVTGGHTYQVSGTEPVTVTITRTSDSATRIISGAITVIDGLEYIASNPDLIAAGFTTAAQGLAHFQEHGQFEGRQLTSFDALEYAASNPDLIAAGITTIDAAALHYITHGVYEGRQLTAFDALEYVASNPDLIAAGIVTADAAVRHYLTHGVYEGRQLTSFDALEYAASNPDLIAAGITTVDAAALHYITHGAYEARQLTSFDAYEYLASNPDLLAAGIKTVDGAAQHYLSFGYNEHRQLALFDAAQYLAANPDVIAAGLVTQDAAATHYVTFGYDEHRILTNPANGLAVLGTSGTDTLTGAAGVSTLIGAGGSDTYVLAAATGTETIYNGVPGTSASGVLQLTGANLTDANVWFERVTDDGVVSSTGNDLKVEILGTSQSATLENWFVNAQSQLSSIQLTSAGVGLGNAQVANLVAAMATFEAGYGADHGGAAFNPTSPANATITDTNVLAAVNADWKH